MSVTVVDNLNRERTSFRAHRTLFSMQTSGFALLVGLELQVCNYGPSPIIHSHQNGYHHSEDGSDSESIRCS